MYAQMERQQSKPKESEKKTQQKCHAKHLQNNFCIEQKNCLPRGMTRTGKTRWRTQKTHAKRKKYVNMRETVRELDRDAENRKKQRELDEKAQSNCVRYSQRNCDRKR